MIDFKKSRYIIAIQESKRTPLVKELLANQYIKNAVNTQEDHPIYGKDWITYWEMFAQEDIPEICPFCGDELKKDEAEGCHILIKSQIVLGKDDYGKTEYIIPGHHKCNCQFDEGFKLANGVKAVEAIKK